MIQSSSIIVIENWNDIDSNSKFNFFDFSLYWAVQKRACLYPSYKKYSKIGQKDMTTKKIILIKSNKNSWLAQYMTPDMPSQGICFNITHTLLVCFSFIFLSHSFNFYYLALQNLSFSFTSISLFFHKICLFPPLTSIILPEKKKKKT